MQIILNGQPREVADRCTIATLLDDIQMERRGIAVELNLEVVPRQQHAERTLCEGDRLEIVTLVGGG
jgi:thiamine biosynthesis protein ThiS